MCVFEFLRWFEGQNSRVFRWGAKGRTPHLKTLVSHHKIFIKFYSWALLQLNNYKILRKLCDHESWMTWNMLPLSLQLFHPECCHILRDFLLETSPYSCSYFKLEIQSRLINNNAKAWWTLLIVWPLWFIHHWFQ